MAGGVGDLTWHVSGCLGFFPVPPPSLSAASSLQLMVNDYLLRMANNE